MRNPKLTLALNFRRSNPCSSNTNKHSQEVWTGSWNWYLRMSIPAVIELSQDVSICAQTREINNHRHFKVNTIWRVRCKATNQAHAGTKHTQTPIIHIRQHWSVWLHKTDIYYTVLAFLGKKVPIYEEKKPRNTDIALLLWKQVT